MRRFVAAVSLMLVACTAQAAVPTTESIRTLLRITRVERTLDTMFDTLNTVMKQAMAQAMANHTTTPEQEKMREAMNTKMVRIYRDEMSWSKMEPLYVNVYQETFTQDEIDGLIAFYRTPTGVAYVDKQPIVQQKSVVAMQAQMGPMMQRMQAAMKETVDEAKAARPQ